MFLLGVGAEWLQNIKETSYEIAAKTLLLDHIYNIIELVVIDYEKSEANELEDKDKISKNEILHLIFLALFHDIRKIISLMDKYNIGLDFSHEKRSFTFLEMFIEKYKKNDDIKRDMEKLSKNMQKLSNSDSSGTLIKKFYAYNKRAQSIF